MVDNKKYAALVAVLSVVAVAFAIALGVVAVKLNKLESDLTPPELLGTPRGRIQYSESDEFSSNKYVEKLEEVLLKEHNSSGVPVFDSRRKRSTSSCNLSNKFGYMPGGNPCVLVSLAKKKLYDSETPEQYWSTESLWERLAPANIKDDLVNGYMLVTCEETGGGESNVTFSVYEESGIYIADYDEFESEFTPFVLVEVQNLLPGVEVEFTCKIWADKFRHEEFIPRYDDEQGVVSFKILKSE